jgi:hypothetical protein
MKKVNLATLVAGILFVAAADAGTNVISHPVAASNIVQVPSQGNFSSLLSRFGQNLVLVGRIDAVSNSGQLSVLGQSIDGFGSPGLAAGDYVAVLGRLAEDGTIDPQAVLLVDEPYVAGATRIFVRTGSSFELSSTGETRVGGQVIDITPLLANVSLTQAKFGPAQTLGIIGIQPTIGGVVVAEGISGQSSVDGSLGTGKTDGSLGTGKTDGSLGTGKTDGSLGTGKTDGSLGTGKTDGSLGTGKTDGSLGTGKTDGSLGTG